MFAAETEERNGVAYDGSLLVIAVTPCLAVLRGRRRAEPVRPRPAADEVRHRTPSTVELLAEGLDDAGDGDDAGERN